MNKQKVLDAIQEPIHSKIKLLYQSIAVHGGEDNCPNMKHEINVLSGLEFSILNNLGLEEYHNSSKFK